MEDNIGPIIFVVCVSATLCFMGFFAGRKYEKKYWEDAIPKQMQKLCVECAGLRYE